MNWDAIESEKFSDRKEGVFMNLKETVLKRTEKTISDGRYKTTSFTLLKEDYETFLKVCKKEKRKPTAIIREMILIFIEQSSQTQDRQGK